MKNRKSITIDGVKKLSNKELLDLLFIEADRLPAIVVDEFISRGNQLIDYLQDIIMDVNNWQREGDEWWVVIHATFILGAIGGKESITPLIGSIKFSDVYEVDWLWETLPSIFGKIGPAALEPLRTVVLDRSNPWMTRATAFDSMAAITVNAPNRSNEVFDFIASILKNSSEDMTVRGLAGGVLLDFQLEKYKKSLLEFAEEEEAIRKYNPTYDRHFDYEDVIKGFEAGNKQLKQYTKNWLSFYEEKDIQARQKRWQEESSWLYPIMSWWRIRKFKKDLKKLEESQRPL